VRARGSGEVLFGFVELEKARQAGRLMRSLAFSPCHGRDPSMKYSILYPNAVAAGLGCNRSQPYTCVVCICRVLSVCKTSLISAKLVVSPLAKKGQLGIRLAAHWQESKISAVFKDRGRLLVYGQR
jgi:hypothetical protein